MDTASAAPAPASSPSQATSAPQGAPAESKGTVGGSSTQATTTPQASTEKYEVKVNGKTMQLSREELIRQAQLGYSANERFDSASKQTKAIEAIVGKFKTNPMEALLDPKLGLSKDQVRAAMEEWYTREFIEPEQMTPEQLRLRNAEAKIKQYEDDERTKVAKEAEAQMEALTSKERESVQTQITSALDASGLPKTKFIVSRMAFYMHKNIQSGWDAPMEVIIDQVKNEQRSMLSNLTESSDADALSALLGDGFINKLRKHDLMRLRQRRAGGIAPEDQITSTPRQSKTQDEGRISYRDVNKNLRRLMQGK